MTRHCNNCNSQQNSWGEYPLNSSGIFAREERCWSCNRWTLSRKLFEKPFEDVLLPETIAGKDLEEYMQTRTYIFDAIQDVVSFETWWSKNLGTVISGKNPYTLWLIVYEPAVRNINEILEKFEINNGYSRYSLESVKSKASSLRIELNGKNPILAIHPSANSYTSFSCIMCNPYVKEIKLPVGTVEAGCDEHGISELLVDYPNNLDNYLRPLDIVKIDKSAWLNTYYHFGIYLGNEQFCHFTDPYSKNKDTRDTNQVVITGRTHFLVGGGFELFRIHPLIPFKHYQEIAKNIAWDEANNHGLRRYCLANNNCEHYANSRIFGLNWSEQVAERPSKTSNWARYVGVNNGRNGFNLKDELERSVRKLNNWHSQQIERQYLQEIPPKKDCRIM